MYIYIYIYVCVFHNLPHQMLWTKICCLTGVQLEAKPRQDCHKTKVHIQKIACFFQWSIILIGSSSKMSDLIHFFDYVNFHLEFHVTDNVHFHLNLDDVLWFSFGLHWFRIGFRGISLIPVWFPTMLIRCSSIFTRCFQLFSVLFLCGHHGTLLS